MTTIDPSFGIVRILRPFVGFEAIYDGQSADHPIQFTELNNSSGTGGTPLDPNAGQPGYGANLLAGLSVPLGSRLSIWLPTIEATHSLSVVPYRWVFTWRYRNTHDYRNRIKPYHFPSQGQGTPDSTAVNTARVIIPAANHGIVYNQAEPAAGVRAVQHLVIEDITAFPAALPFPFTPTGTSGAFQQGMLDPAAQPVLAATPLYTVYDLMCFGDDLLIGAYRDTSTFTNWQFTSGVQADLLFSQLFGNGDAVNGPYPQIGVYVTMGSSP